MRNEESTPPDEGMFWSRPRPMPRNVIFKRVKTPLNSITSWKLLSVLYETCMKSKSSSLLWYFDPLKNHISRHRTGTRPKHTFVRRSALLISHFCTFCVLETWRLGCGGLWAPTLNSASMGSGRLSVRSLERKEGGLKRFYLNFIRMAGFSTYVYVDFWTARPGLKRSIYSCSAYIELAYGTFLWSTDFLDCSE